MGEQSVPLPFPVSRGVHIPWRWGLGGSHCWGHDSATSKGERRGSLEANVQEQLHCPWLIKDRALFIVPMEFRDALGYN